MSVRTCDYSKVNGDPGAIELAEAVPTAGSRRRRQEITKRTLDSILRLGIATHNVNGPAFFAKPFLLRASA